MKTLLHLFIAILSISVVHINIVSVRSQCLHDQRSLLIQFKQSLDFDIELSVKLKTWNSGIDCCSWKGVTCDFNGHVIGFDLSNDGIISGINDSSTLFHLQYLQHLDLSYNNFDSQKMPTKFNKLVNLRYLNLAYNGFMGQIPVGTLELPDLSMLVQNLSRLEELHLDGVRVSSKGKTWSKALSSSLPNLRVLSLSGCQLSSPIDSSLLDLRFLSDIDLSRNNFSSPFPDFLVKFSNLSSLILSRSGLYGIVPEKIFHMPSLKILDFSQNDQIHGSLPEFYHNGSLQTLDLSVTSFFGTIPRSIGNLQHLQYLHLAHINFVGLIPSSIGNLQKLQNLILRGNNFVGLIPSSIADLKELVILDLSSNNLTGPVPSFSSLKRLGNLMLFNNKLNGSISSTNWEELSDLENIELKFNSFSGEISSFLFGMPRLVSLILSHNLFTELPNEFPKYLSSSRLEELCLACNRIHGKLPSWIWEMKNIKHLNVSHNFLTEVSKPSQGIISMMISVDLHANRIQGQIEFLPSSVQFVDYSNNNFNSVIQTTLFQYLSSTRILIFSNNNFQGSIPSTICSISLQVLDLSNNSFSGTIPKCLFQNSPSLSALKLRSNKLNGSIPDKFAKSCSLEFLDLSGNLLEGKIAKSMKNCKMLQLLSLGKNQLNDIFPLHLMKISTLQVIGLQSNKLHGSVVCQEKKGSWENLHIINIASNNFGGELPKDCLQTWVRMIVHTNEAKPLGDLNTLFDDSITDNLIISSYLYETLVTAKGQEMKLWKIFTDYTLIDFSCNNFQGLIPKVIGELNELRFLNLSHNSLDGRIPPSMGRMKNLESLDLSRNNLSGLIPSELASLTFLGYGDFSYNQLVGQIPTSTQLQSFPSSHFEGNLGLCGLPLKTECSKQNPLTKEPDDDASYSKSAIEWSFISIEVGFTFGLGVVILPLTFSRRWRIRYYRHVERVLFKLLPRLDPRNYKSRERKIGNLQNLRRQ